MSNMLVVYEEAVWFSSVRSVGKKYVVWFGSVRQIPGSIKHYTQVTCPVGTPTDYWGV
jgi:hypothetical protein